MVRTIFVKNIAELSVTAKEILSLAGNKKIFCFYGELGAGKTTLIKEICKTLGVKDSGSSPTFSLINEYETGNGEKLYHFDLYRLRSIDEIFDIGYEEYIYSGNYCFIEWPEKIERLLPPDCIKIKVDVKEEERIISIS